MVLNGFKYLSLTMNGCPKKITHNVGAYAVAGIGGLKNEAQRNVKPDLLRPVPHY